MKFHLSKDDIISFPVKQDAILPETRPLDDSHSRLTLLLGGKTVRLLIQEPHDALASLTSQDVVRPFVPTTIGIDERWQVNLSIKQPQELSQKLILDPLEAIEVFFCYAPEDDHLRETLEKHLKPVFRQLRQQKGLCVTLHNGEVGAGRAWKKEIERHLTKAHIILLLVSVDFLNSDFCTDIEIELAIARHVAGEARVIPVILRPCIWDGEKFGDLRALPKGNKPVTTWSNKDNAFTNIAVGVQKAISDLIDNSDTQEMP